MTKANRHWTRSSCKLAKGLQLPAIEPRTVGRARARLHSPVEGDVVVVPQRASDHRSIGVARIVDAVLSKIHQHLWPSLTQLHQPPVVPTPECDGGAKLVGPQGVQA